MSVTTNIALSIRKALIEKKREWIKESITIAHASDIMYEVSVDTEGEKCPESSTAKEKNKYSWDDKEERNMSENTMITKRLATNRTTTKILYPKIEIRKKGEQNTKKHPAWSQGNVKYRSSEKGPKSA